MARQAMQRRQSPPARSEEMSPPGTAPARLAQLSAQLGASPSVQMMQPIKDKLAQRAKRKLPAQRVANRTGLPDQVKQGVESLSGMALDHVRVHYNSPQPAQLSAHAFTQGAQIHVAPGQERHLPHEAWHVVQQAQGRVRPTEHTASGVALNTDHALESEADRMGAQAVQRAKRRKP